MKKATIFFVVLLSVILAFNSSVFAKKLRVWCAEEPPGNFIGPDGKPAGLAVEFVQELLNRTGQKDVVIKLLPWKRAYTTGLKEPNVVLFSAARTKQREDLFHWIALMMRKPWTIYKKKGNDLKITSLDDAKKVKRIGVLRGGIRETFLKDKGFTNLEAVANHEQNVKKLLINRLDLIFYSPQGAAYTCKLSNLNFDDLEPVLNPYSSLSHVMMSKNGTSEELVELWQKTAKEIKADGTFEKICNKWIKYVNEEMGIDAEYKDGALNYWKE